MKEIKQLSVMISIAIPVCAICACVDIVSAEFFLLYFSTLPLMWVISKIICKYMEWNK